MKQKSSARKRRARTKTVLRLPDLEHVKSAVLNSLNSLTQSVAMVTDLECR
jgi:hypothetical protein